MSNIWEKENEVWNNLIDLSDWAWNILSVSWESILIQSGERVYKKSNWNKEL